MAINITKIREIIKEKSSRLKLYLHINKQSKNKQVLVFLLVIIIFLFITILSFGIMQTGAKINFLAEQKTIIDPLTTQKKVENTENTDTKKVPQIIFDKKSYIELLEPIENLNKAGSVNIRESVCGTNIIGASNWKAVGQIIEGPITQECLGDKWNWYKVKWSNGAIGWSVDNYFQKVEAIKKFSQGDVELEYPFDWQVTESRDSKGDLLQILFQKNGSKLIVNTLSTSSIIGTIENSQSACVGDLVDINSKKESYRVSYGYYEIGEKKEKISYYKYINKSEFFTRQNPSFEVIYNKYLIKTWDNLSRTDTNKMPYIDIFDIQACVKTITPAFEELIYIDLQVKPGASASQIIEEADKIVISLKKINSKTLN